MEASGAQSALKQMKALLEKKRRETCDYGVTVRLAACFVSAWDFFLPFPLFTYHRHIFIKLL